jgi:hypothetical protein
MQSYSSSTRSAISGTGDLALGFVGDVGDLAKLVMADCLWAVLVLADRYQVDLAAEFTAMTSEIENRLAPDDQPEPVPCAAGHPARVTREAPSGRSIDRNSHCLPRR